MILESNRKSYRELVLLAPDLQKEQRRILEYAINSYPESGFDKATEARFWSIVGMVLTTEQMLAVKTDLPHQYQTQARPDNYFALPDLEPKIANRVLSRFLNLQAETSANMTRIQTLEKEVKAEGGAPKLAKLQEMLELRKEMLETREALVEDLDTVLTGDQRSLLGAIPPLGSLEFQNKFCEWLCKPGHQSQEQQEYSLPHLQQLHEDFQVIAPQVEARSENFDEANARGQMTQMMETRNLAKPLQARRSQIARQLCLMMSPQQIENYLEKGLADQFDE